MMWKIGSIGLHLAGKQVVIRWLSLPRSLECGTQHATLAKSASEELILQDIEGQQKKAFQDLVSTAHTEPGPPRALPGRYFPLLPRSGRARQF
jgi:hypothetical protein